MATPTKDSLTYSQSGNVLSQGLATFVEFEVPFVTAPIVSLSTRACNGTLSSQNTTTDGFWVNIDLISLS